MGIVCYICGMTGLLIATSNPGKREEYEYLLASLNLPLVTPGGINLSIHVDECGQSYAENARSKALAYCQASGLLTLADDSGLEVDALHGEPGLHSARYGGPDLDDRARFRLLLQQLDGVPWEERSARFRCVIVVAAPGGVTYSSEGVCEGLIAFGPKGEHGFGYDPVFCLPEHDCTMSELPPRVKNRVSHRARAVEKMLPVLSRVVADESVPGHH
jgi:XTP/dITP diphosphohydrolase